MRAAIRPNANTTASPTTSTRVRKLSQIGFDVAQFGHGYNGRLSSGLGARRWGASSSTLTTGHSAASSTGARK